MSGPPAESFRLLSDVAASRARMAKHPAPSRGVGYLALSYDEPARSKALVDNPYPPTARVYTLDSGLTAGPHHACPAGKPVNPP
jgi:hypothetical protein